MHKDNKFNLNIFLKNKRRNMKPEYEAIKTFREQKMLLKTKNMIAETKYSIEESEDIKFKKSPRR